MQEPFSLSNIKTEGGDGVSGYSDAGASTTKNALKAFHANSGSPVLDIDFNNTTLRQRGRMLYMASPIAAAIINTNRTKIVGSGLKMKASINSKLLGLTDEQAQKWCEKTEAEFRWWCENRLNCDMLGENNFYEIQRLAVKSWLMSGDVFVLIKREKSTDFNPYGIRLQVVEADRVCTPAGNGVMMYGTTEGTLKENEIHDGVEVDKMGRIVAYHVCSQYPNFYTKSPEWQRVKAVGEKTGLPNVLHLMDPERPDQYRGVTLLAPTIEMILQGRRYTEAELTASIIQSYFTAWIKIDGDVTESPIKGNYGGEDEAEADSEAETDDYDDEIEMSPGKVIRLKKGESVDYGNPNVPTAGYEVFMKTINKQIGAGVETPYEVFMKEFTASYSASKGALEEFAEVAKVKRSLVVSDLCQPVYEIWLAEAVARGRISAPGFFDDPLIRKAWCDARWDGPAQTHLDPEKEAKANEIIVKNGWKTNEQVTREFYGENWNENIQDCTQEAKIMADYLKTIRDNTTPQYNQVGYNGQSKSEDEEKEGKEDGED